jgi:hypothetical protein
MARFHNGLLICAAAIIFASIGAAAFAPGVVMPFLKQLGVVWNFLLLIGIAGTLFWFVYWMGLRRILRAKRISKIRWKRLLDEAAARDAEDASKS